MADFSPRLPGSTGVPASPDGASRGAFLEETPDLVRRQLEWDKQMESFTREEMDIHKAHVNIYREQILNCSREITALRRELVNSAEQHSKALALQAEEFVVLAARQQETATRADLAAGLGALRRAVRDEQSAILEPLLQQFTSREASIAAASGQPAEIHSAINDANAQIANAHSRLAGLESLLHSSFEKQSEVQQHSMQAFKRCGNEHGCLKVRLGALERAVADTAKDNSCALKATHAMLEDINRRLSICEEQGMDLQRLLVDFAERSSLELADGAGQHRWAQQFRDLHDLQEVDVGQHTYGMDDAPLEMNKKFESFHDRPTAQEQLANRALLSASFASLQERTHCLEALFAKASVAGTTRYESMEAMQARLEQAHSHLDASEKRPAEAIDAMNDGKASALTSQTEPVCRVEQLDAAVLAAE